MLPPDLTTEIVKTVVQIAVENAIKYGPGVTKKLLKQAQTTRVNNNAPFVAKSDLVDREAARRAIESALWEKGTARIIYLSGSGGAGKTRLLEEAVKRVASFRSILRWAGIFDFYHTDLHDVLQLQSTIADRLDAEKHFFQEYRHANQQFSTKRQDGMFSLATDESVHTEFAKLNQIFINELNGFTRKHQAVIVLDTLENIGEEQDIIQQLFGLELYKENLSLKHWLMDLAQNVENTVILLAGRPNNDLRDGLKQINQMLDGRVEIIEVGGLTRSDASTLLNFYTRKLPPKTRMILSQNADRLWHVTNGMPVQLALIVELLIQNPQVLETDENRNISELEQKLIHAFFNSEGRRTLFFLALARKGLSPDLLNFLQPDWPKAECARKLKELERIALVKKRPGEYDLFLHDAIYELFDKYSSRLDWANGELPYWFQRLFEYYDGLGFASKDASQRDKFTINLLYYGLRYDALLAFYKIFVRWSEISINGYEMELETQLRNEVFIYLRDSANHEQLQKNQTTKLTHNIFNQDNAARWIKRLIRKAQYERAAQIAETLLESGFDKYKYPGSKSIALSKEAQSTLSTIVVSASPIFWAYLLTYYGEALVYLNRPEIQVNTILQDAINILQSSILSKDHPLWWLRNRLLGHAYDRIGYLSRVKGHFRNAVDYYQQALPFFQETEIEDEYAFTQNNLAFVLALLGDSTKARIFAEGALTTRLRLGQRYPLALSYNTLGLIKALDDPNTLSGRQDCEYALSIFEEINTPRGIGLACNALGFIFRKRGDGWVKKQCNPDQAIQYYQESERFLERAKGIFRDGEKIRLWEACNELGSLNKEWMRLSGVLENRHGSQEKFSKSVESHLEALKLAQDGNMKFQEMDTLDDLAQVYMDNGDFEQAQKYLGQCKILLPPEFSVENIKDQSYPGEIYWLSLAKLQLGNGLVQIRSSRTVKHNNDNSRIIFGVHQLLMSFIYFQLYSAHPKYLGQKAHHIAMILKELDIPGDVILDTFQKIVREYNQNLTELCSALSQEYKHEKLS